MHTAVRDGSWRLEVYAAVGLQLSVLLALEELVSMSAAGWVAAVAYLGLLCVGVGVGWLRLNRDVPDAVDRSLGPANLITLARALLVGAVIALVVSSLAEEWSAEQRALTVGLAVVGVILDGVDGRVARRTRSSSPFGARFDVEIDSVLALALAVGLAWALTPLALVIGLARYLYLAAALVWPWLNRPLPARWSRKIIGVSGSAALIVASSGLLPPTVAVALVAVATVAVLYSFGRDVVAQHRLGRAADGDAPDQAAR